MALIIFLQMEYQVGDFFDRYQEHNDKKIEREDKSNIKRLNLVVLLIILYIITNVKNLMPHIFFKALKPKKWLGL